MRKAVFLIGVLDSVAHRWARPLSNENLDLLGELASANDLDARMVFATMDMRLAGLEKNVKLADVREGRDRVVQEIQEYDPELIFCFGRTAASSCFNRGSIVLSDYGRRSHVVNDFPGARVFVLDSLSRVAAQPGVAQWVRLDLKAACDGYGETVWGEYDILLPGTPEWHRPPHKLLSGIDPFGEECPTDIRWPGMVGFDLETFPGLDPWAPDARIRMGMLSFAPGYAVVVQCTPGSEFPAWFTEILADPSITKCGSNIAFDVKWCARFGIPVSGVWDTGVAEHIIDETNPKKDLKALTFKYLPRLGDYSYEHRQLVKRRKGWEHVADDEQYNYAAADAEASIAAALAQSYQILDLGLSRPHRLALDLYPCLTSMQIHGTIVDEGKNNQMEDAFDVHLDTLRNKIQGQLGPVNPASPVQLATALVDFIPGINLKKTKFKRMWDAEDVDDPEDENSTAKSILLREAAKHPVILDVLEFRKWSKLHGTYVKGMREKHIVRHGGRAYIHPSFNQNRVETNRLSSSNPNLQNIPRKPGDDDPATLNVKAQFCSRFPDGGQIMEADFSQAELRVAAMLSKDPGLIKALTSGRDVHIETAAMLLGKDYDDITPEERQRCKTLNFLILYGGGANTLARQLDIEKDEAKVLIKKYFTAFPKLDRFIKSVHKQVKRDLVVESSFGFRRHFRAPPNNNWNQWEGWAIQRQAFNHLVQNTAACITFVAIVQLHCRMAELGMKSLMFGTVHDSILFDVYPGELDQLAALAKEIMENPDTGKYGVELTVPMVVDLEVGPNWGEKKGL